MASVGNNIKGENTYLRDSFLDGSEGEYVARLVQYIQNGKIVPGISISSLSVNSMNEGLALIQEIRKRVKDKMKGLRLDVRKGMEEDLEFYLGMSCGQSKMVNYINAQKYAEFYYKNNELKVMISEVLAEMVDQGFFNEEQMYVVEAQMGLLLSSIEDLHAQLIMER